VLPIEWLREEARIDAEYEQWAASGEGKAMLERIKSEATA